MKQAEEPGVTSGESAGPPVAGAPPEEQWAAARRIERSLTEIRALLELTVRTRRRGDFSLARMVGTLLQMLAAALVIVALADWAFDAPAVNQLLKLVFAGVLQLGALTAFLLARWGW